MAGTILVADDDPHIREVVRFALDKAGFETVEAADGREALRAFGARKADLVVLDIGMPELDGLGVCRELRKSSDVPILFLSSHDSEVDRIVGLEIGGDDYVAKPFSPRELAARVKAVLRRAPAAAAAVVKEDGDTFTVNTSKRAIAFFGTALELSKYEYEILRRFIERKGHVFSRDQLMDMVWEQPETSLDRTVDAHIKNIRAKLRAVRPDLEPIVTHRGAGYSLRDDL